MQKTIQNYVLENWNRLFEGRPKPGSLSTLQITRSHGKEYRFGRIVHLLFGEGSETPAVAARFCRDSSYEGYLKEEAGLMKGLMTTGAGRYLPAVLDMPVIGGRTVMVESAAMGLPMSVLAEGARQRMKEDAFRGLVAGHMETAAVFLKELRTSTVAEAPAAGAGLWDETGGILSRYVKMFGLTGPEEYAIFGLGRAVEALSGEDAPMYVIHSDYTPSNIFLDAGGGVKVIDWEFSRRGRLGFMDTMRFVYYYFKLLQKAGAVGKDAFHETFVKGEGWYYDLALRFAMDVEGERAREGFHDMLAFFLVNEACLQAEVVGWATLGIQYVQPVRDLVNSLTGHDYLRDKAITERDNVIAEKDRLLAYKDKVITENGRSVAARDETIRARNAAISGCQAKVAGLEQELAGVYGSKSWRLTYPLRWVSARSKGQKS